jgi:glycosyltransferase involved in cell wall biosynthesis
MHEPQQTSRPTLSVVIPIHNEAECCPEMVRRLTPVLAALAVDYEIIFVDDASTDASYEIVAGLAGADTHIKCLSFSRNMGHQAALACGLESSCGDAVIMMDGDLQHPPELIPELVSKWREGFEVVNTARRSTEDVGFLKHIASRGFYRFFNSISDVKLTPDSSDFRLLDRRCVDALLSMRENLKFFRGMVDYIGFRQTVIPFDCPRRFAGSRSYSWRKSLKLASSGIFSFSTFALKLPFFLGLFVLVFVAFYGLISACLLLSGVMKASPGWTSIIVILLMTFGAHLVFMGIMGLYISKLYLEMKARPLFFIRRSVGFDNTHGHGTHTRSHGG